MFFINVGRVFSALKTIILSITSRILIFIQTEISFSSSMQTQISKFSWQDDRVLPEKDQSFTNGIPLKQMKLNFREDQT